MFLPLEGLLTLTHFIYHGESNSINLLPFIFLQVILDLNIVLCSFAYVNFGSSEPTQTSQGPPTVQPDLKVRPLALIGDTFLILYLYLLHWEKTGAPGGKTLPCH